MPGTKWERLDKCLTLVSSPTCLGPGEMSRLPGSPPLLYSPRLLEGRRYDGSSVRKLYRLFSPKFKKMYMYIIYSVYI